MNDIDTTLKLESLTGEQNLEKRRLVEETFLSIQSIQNNPKIKPPRSHKEDRSLIFLQWAAVKHPSEFLRAVQRVEKMGTRAISFERNCGTKHGNANEANLNNELFENVILSSLLAFPTLTAAEASQLTGASRSYCSQRLNKLVKAGKLKKNLIPGKGKTTEFKLKLGTIKELILKYALTLKPSDISGRPSHRENLHMAGIFESLCFVREHGIGKVGLQTLATPLKVERLLDSALHSPIPDILVAQLALEFELEEKNLTEISKKLGRYSIRLLDHQVNEVILLCHNGDIANRYLKVMNDFRGVLVPRNQWKLTYSHIQEKYISERFYPVRGGWHFARLRSGIKKRFRLFVRCNHDTGFQPVDWG